MPIEILSFDQSELVKGTGVIPEPSVDTCSVFTGMPMICFNHHNMATVHAISAWPVGCAIPGMNVGVWSQLTATTVKKLLVEVERYKKVGITMPKPNSRIMEQVY